MKRILAVTTGIALALTLAACSSNSDSDASASPTPVVSDSASAPDRDALIAELRADGEANGAPAEQIDCVIEAIDSLGAEELQSVKDGTPDEDTQAVMAAASEKCIPSESPTPEAS